MIGIVPLHGAFHRDAVCSLLAAMPLSCSAILDLSIFDKLVQAASYAA
jgi:hypothetical protein